MIILLLLSGAPRTRRGMLRAEASLSQWDSSWLASRRGRGKVEGHCQSARPGNKRCTPSLVESRDHVVVETALSDRLLCYPQGQLNFPPLLRLSFPQPNDTIKPGFPAERCPLYGDSTPDFQAQRKKRHQWCSRYHTSFGFFSIRMKHPVEVVLGSNPSWCRFL